MKLGDGEEVRFLILREEDAARWHQHKFYRGYLLEPYVEYTGDTDGHAMFKALFLPDGKTSLAETTYDEFQKFNESVEAFIRTRVPKALDGKEFVR